MSGSGIITVGSRMQFFAAGMVFERWTRCDVTRDLKEISGSFEFEYLDEGRADAAGVTLLSPPPFFEALKPLMACTVKIDGETVLSGYIDDIDLDEDGEKISAKVTGRDKTGDLKDCSACPTGPAEFKGLDLGQIATMICQPFGITVTVQTDIGEPFERLGVSPHETALQVLEKAARQRAVLLVSDGVGGLLLTTGGSSRAPYGITRGDNIIRTQSRRSVRKRFSDVWVKGQSERGAGHRLAGAVALDHSVVPFGGSGAEVPPVPTPTSTTGQAMRTNAAAGTLMTGHAQDPEITRWRPHVRMTRTQSGMSTTQEQAEWAVRVARGEGDDLHYTVADWRAGSGGPGGAGQLWRPNEVSTVSDPYSGIDTDMLIAGVRYELSDHGPVATALRVVGLTAYDRIDEADRKRQPSGRKGRKPKAVPNLDASVTGVSP